MADATLLRRENVAFDTTAFHFTKPAGFDFTPGQAIDLILGPPGDNADDAKHAFSIVSAPHDADLVIATRMRQSPFKRALGVLALGSGVDVDGPFGELTLDADRSRPAVLIAGGIGITPFMSIVRHATRRELQQPLTLLYSNRRPEDAAFLDELTRIAGENENFRLRATMTRMHESSRAWQGSTGAIDDALLSSACAGLASPIFYVAGPPAMVQGLRQTLSLYGVRDEDVRSEEFFGY